MASFKFNPIVIAVILLIVSMVRAEDTILEFKAGYFLATDCIFKNIYDKGGAIYGPEVTFSLNDSKCWYGFASVNYFQKDGNSLGLGDATKVELVPLGIGVKYFIPSSYSRFDFYVGLGFQPVHTKVINCSPYVPAKQSQWGFGGVAKIGTYINITHNLLLDLFIDYSFVNVNFKTAQIPAGPVTPLKADISGAIFGVGLGYRFN